MIETRAGQTDVDRPGRILPWQLFDIDIEGGRG